MKKSKCLLLFFFTGFPLFIFSQGNKIKLTCNVFWDSSKIEIDRSYPIHDKHDSISFKKIKFYLSNFYLVIDEKKKELKDVYLFDVEKNNAIYFRPNETGIIEKFGFLLGTDSVTNVSGAMQGDLDPSNGMYWTWQSGYINVKIEGELFKGDGSSETFHYHLGGYRNPFIVSKYLDFPLKNLSSDEINLSVNLSSFMHKALNSETKNIMSPNSKAIQLLEWLANSMIIY